MDWKHGFHGVLVLVVLAVGCAHPISPGLREQVDAGVTAERLLNAPQQHAGRKVVLGGVIVETRNFDGYSEIEAIQVDLDCFGYPGSRRTSKGRVIFRRSGYVESMVYAKGRKVTVGGSVRGVQSGKVGGSGYEFLVVDVEEIRLWDTPYPVYRPYPYYPAWGPFYRGYPYSYLPYYYWYW